MMTCRGVLAQTSNARPVNVWRGHARRTARGPTQASVATYGKNNYKSHQLPKGTGELRRLVQSTTPAEMSDILHQVHSSQALKMDVSLDMLYHAAEAWPQTQLQNDAAGAEVLHTLCSSLAEDLHRMKPSELGRLVRALASWGPTSELVSSLVQQVAAQELAANHPLAPQTWNGYSDADLCSLISSFGRLASGGGMLSPEAAAYVAAMAATLAQRLRAEPYVGSPPSCSACADVAAACAAIYRPPGSLNSAESEEGAWHEGGSSSSSAGGPNNGISSNTGNGSSSSSIASVPPSVEDLLDEMAYAVWHDLDISSRQRSRYAPGDVVRLLSSYAQLGRRSEVVSDMLDALAELVVERIRCGDARAVSRPQDLSTLLQAYARLHHSSPVVPQLLSAVGEQVCRVAAKSHQQEGRSMPAPHHTSPRLHGNPAAPAATPNSSSGRGQAGAPAFSFPATLAILQSFADLCYSPPPLLLQGLMPGVCCQLHDAPPPQVLRLLRLLALAEHHPGQAALALMLARLADAAADSVCDSATIDGASPPGSREAAAGIAAEGWRLARELGACSA